MMCIVRRSLTFIKILKAGHSIDSGKSFSISVENCLEFSSFQFLLGSINSLYKAQSSIILFSGIHRQPTESRVISYHPQKLLKPKTHSCVAFPFNFLFFDNFNFTPCKENQTSTFDNRWRSPQLSSALNQQIRQHFHKLKATSLVQFASILTFSLVVLADNRNATRRKVSSILDLPAQVLQQLITVKAI